MADEDIEIPSDYVGIAKTVLSIAFPAALSEGLEWTAALVSLRCGGRVGVVTGLAVIGPPVPPGTWASSTTPSTWVV